MPVSALLPSRRSSVGSEAGEEQPPLASAFSILSGASVFELDSRAPTLRAAHSAAIRAPPVPV
ncbi:MAG: hypothetical protein ACK4NM_18565, partial [Hydrogenophaga sp.]